jgi:hypothetical protein
MLDRVPRFASALALALAYALIENILWAAREADGSSPEFWRLLLRDEAGVRFVPYLSFLGAWIGFTIAGLRACTVPLWQLLLSGSALAALSFFGPTMLDSVVARESEELSEVVLVFVLDILRFSLLALLVALFIGRASRRD